MVNPKRQRSAVPFGAHERAMRASPVSRARGARHIILVAAATATLIAWHVPVLGAAAKQRHFATEDEAVAALVNALKASDSKKLLDILGAGAKPLVNSGDPVAQRQARQQFVQAYEQSHSFETSGDRAVLEVGADKWPFPIPLVKDTAGWRFDTAAGQDEIINRRVGRNELSTIQSCLAYVDAQREYYERNPDDSSLRHYAQKIASTPGKRDGLFWSTTDDEPDSPLGPNFARALAEGYKFEAGKAVPYHGYYYRILTAQGPDAPGGAYDYVAHGKMIGGFALVAYPAVYDASGVMTFIVNQDGVVFQKDLGPKTTAIAKAMKTFNPDSTWTRVEHGGVGQP